MTLKQLETFYWVVRLGTFAQAAVKLHTTQSTVSSRIQDLETSLNTLLLDRGSRTSRPTAKGRELLGHVERMLNIGTQILSTIGNLSSLTGIVRVGVAELVAEVWLPEWVASVNRRYPGVSLEMDVDLTLNLAEKLSNGAIDLAFLPGPLSDSGLRQTPLGSVKFDWMASPALQVPVGPLSAADFQGFPLLLLSNKSNLFSVISHWLNSDGLARISACERRSESA